MDQYTAWGDKSGLSSFANPFATYSNNIYPKSVLEVFQWAEWLLTRHGVYAQAIKKSVCYFLSDIELSGKEVGRRQRRAYSKMLVEDFGLLSKMATISVDFLGLGNSFTSVVLPIERQLICPECATMRPLKNIDENAYKFQDWQFTGTCPVCRKSVVFIRNDAVDKAAGDILSIVRWPPQDMIVSWCPVSDLYEYRYKIPQELAAKITSGDPMILRGLPWEFVEAVQKGEEVKMNPETFKHIKCETISTMSHRLKGWGLPLFMCNFPQVVQLQILERFNEAIAMDYIVPMRMLTPDKTAGGMDPLQTFGMNNFMGAVHNMIKEHKLDPTTWHTLPSPVAYHVIGGEAKNLAPVELIDRSLDTLLSSMGIPQEFYRTTLSTGGPKVGLKMYEKQWSHYMSETNSWLNWYLNCCSRFLMWKKMSGRLAPPSLVEDEETKQLKLSLATAGKISMDTAMKAYGIDPDYEQEKIAEENAYAAELASEQQYKQEKQTMLSEIIRTPPPTAMPAGQAPAGMPGAAGQLPGPMEAYGGGAQQGAPAPGQSLVPQAQSSGNPTMDQIMGDADGLAQQLLTADTATRRNTLADLKRDNFSLYSLVSKKLEGLEQGARAQGVAAARSGQM